MPIRLLIFAVVGTLLISSASLLSSSGVASSTLHLPDKDISLIVVNTSETKTKGLSNRPSLAEDSAMLFVFDEPDKYGIWMKDMKFSIDIFWLDEKGKIIHIEKNVSPETYPNVFFPPHKSLYVLEANAGFADANRLKVGNSLNFNK